MPKIIKDEDRQAIYQMWRDGQSCTVIADKFQKSKSGVLNIIARGRKMGLDLKKRYDDDRGKRDTRNNIRLSVKAMAIAPVPDNHEGILLLDATDKNCREIVGRLRCCGQNVVEGMSYCPEHCQKNYVGWK
jgi:hypothetical protein